MHTFEVLAQVLQMQLTIASAHHDNIDDELRDWRECERTLANLKQVKIDAKSPYNLFDIIDGCDRVKIMIGRRIHELESKSKK